jgi:hypothetical protein
MGDLDGSKQVEAAETLAFIFADPMAHTPAFTEALGKEKEGWICGRQPQTRKVNAAIDVHRLWHPSLRCVWLTACVTLGVCKFDEGEGEDEDEDAAEEGGLRGSTRSRAC